jgi:hypothetical protein
MIERIPLTSDVFISQHAQIEQALNEAVRLALLDHKRAGNPIASWRDGKVVIIPPEEIPVDDPLTNNVQQTGANGSK